MNIVNPGRLRVVLDTNVYISAFVYPQGLTFQLWRKALSGRYRLLMSPAIINEIADVLRSKFGWNEDRILAGLKLLAKAAEIVATTTTLQVVEEDDDDNRILECALDGKADLIVSGDQHLKRLKAYRGIAIVSPMDFQRTLGK
jgi:putative PIN family toxin of toxin-antitoxin system